MAKSVKDQAAFYLSQLDKELSKVPQLVQLEQVTKIPKTYAVLGVSSIFTLLVFLNVMGNLLTNLLGFVYPAYRSFKAIESKQKDDDTLWLTYWYPFPSQSLLFRVVFGAFNVVEYFSDLILHWVPFYYVFKSVFCRPSNFQGIILYLILPQTKGACVLYSKLIRPHLVKGQDEVDAAIDKIKETASAAINEFSKTD
ncbi:MAG: hypothetical protein SGCHY_003218 [Lobulomycetales sp.]